VKAEMYDDDNKRRCLRGEIDGKIKKMGLFLRPMISAAGVIFVFSTKN
jgi:hypothetical protein